MRVQAQQRCWHGGKLQVYKEENEVGQVGGRTGAGALSLPEAAGLNIAERGTVINPSPWHPSTTWATA